MNPRIKRVAIWTGVVILSAPLLAFALFIGWIFAFFKSGIFFAGDGEYRQPGTPGGVTFEVTFPEIDTSVRKVHTYRFTRLAPTMGWVVGVRAESPSDALVRLTLTNERGAKVFEETIDLSKAARIVTTEGLLREVPIDSRGSVRIEAVGRGEDGGWGTHFEPRWLGKYVLRAEILRPSSRAGSRARVAMEAYTAGP